MSTPIPRKTPRAWKTLSKKTILDHGRFLKVEEHRVQLPDGRVIPDWTWVIIPDAVIVLARLLNKRFLIFQQTKYALEGVSLAPVGGMLEEGEKPLSAAKRELMEEMGCEATNWVPLGCYVLDPNRGVAKVHYFLALDASRVAEPDSDDLEDQEMLEVTREELERALFAGDFKEATWAALVSMTLNHLRV
ncbi:MAG: NUDIX hydrolase [Anaerolineaceae bacterium]|nr:NUDIX hydrolase [Anaerolineaceae bacterium]MBN2676627.1 NUDIX hydrolase [Anaerolineaceae bacterium]